MYLVFYGCGCMVCEAGMVLAINAGNLVPNSIMQSWLLYFSFSSDVILIISGLTSVPTWSAGLVQLLWLLRPWPHHFLPQTYLIIIKKGLMDHGYCQWEQQVNLKKLLFIYNCNSNPFKLICSVLATNLNGSKSYQLLSWVVMMTLRNFSQLQMCMIYTVFFPVIIMLHVLGAVIL